MKIGISFAATDSIFDSSRGQQALTLATVFQKLGHEIVLLNQSTPLWWKDEQVLKGRFASIPMKEFVTGTDQVDLFVDMDGLCLATVRSKIAKRVAVLFRGSPDFTFLEKASYMEVNPLYTLGGAHEVWVWDAFIKASAIPMLQSLFEGLPVRRVPYVWIEDFLKQQELPIVNQQETPIPVTSQQPTLLIAEKNTTNTSNCIVPLLAASKWKKASAIRIVNGKSMESDKFFQKNIRDNCVLTIPVTYEDRSRCVDWSKNVIVAAHTRFTPFRPLLLDLIWLGIPFVHNCPLLQDCPGLSFYPETDIQAMVTCLDTVQSVSAKDWITQKWSVEKGLGAWKDIVEVGIRRKGGDSGSVATVAAVAPVATVAAVATVAPVAPVATVAPVAPVVPTTTAVTVGFSDMWEGFDPADNFFLDLLKQYTTVKGVAATATNQSMNLLICGPFGTVWQTVSPSVPKVYFSGERTRLGETADPRISLYLTHELVEDSRHIRFPIWQLFLNWFGTDGSKRNPNGLPVKLATQNTEYKKSHFCAFVVSNPTNPERNQAFETLSSYKPIRSGGQYKNNIGGSLFCLYGGGGGGDTAKHDFLKDHTFCICYENSVADGYVTEKLLHAKMAGCIPLYGGCDASLDFDPSGYIHVKPGDSIVDLVKQLEADPVRLAAMAARPAFSPLGFSKARAQLDRVSTALLTLAGVRTPLFCSFATAKYLPSLEQNLQGISMLRQKTRQPLGFVAYFGVDILDLMIETLKSKFPWIQCRRIPSLSPLQGFPDFLEPVMFGWKLWILKDICNDVSFRGRPILYTDSATVWLRLPEEMLSIVKQKGVCLTLDTTQINRAWCSSDMVKEMSVTDAELAEHQLMAGFVGFEAGHPAALKLVDDAYMWGSKRECLFGSHMTHRHDQSILSVLRIRQQIPTVDGKGLVCATSMRKAHQKGASVYLHRGRFTLHHPVLPGIDDIWIISLDRRADRYESWKATYPMLASLTNRLPAVDGKLLELTQNLFTFFEKNDFMWKKSVAGCALSHTLVWAQLASEQTFVKNYLILEDDQRFAEPDWQQQLEKAMAAAPADAELLYLGGVLPGNLAAYPSCLEPVNDLWATIKPNQYFSQTPLPIFHFCAYAYVLTRIGAQKLCQALGRQGCPTSIDHFLGGIGLKKYVLRTLMATCYQAEDPVYKNSEFDDFSRVDQFDSDIWNNKECFTDFADFEKKAMYPPLYQMIVDVLTQAPHSIQTRNTIRADALQTVVPNSKIVYYFNRTDGKEHDGTLEEGWLRSLWPDFVFRSMAEPFVPGSWILVARPQMAFWRTVATQLDGKGVPFQVLHLSDEFGSDPVDFYELRHCRRIVRNYWREDCCRSAKVHTIPLGFAKGGASGNTVVGGLLSDRPYTWSFHGTNWFDRRELLAPLTDIVPNSCTWQKDFMDPLMTPAKDYQKLLSETRFVPVPRGNSPETFRLYEALEHGCIPVYVRSDGDDVFWNWICRWLPLRLIRTWTEAADQIRLERTESVEAYRKELLDAWAAWKTVCRNAFVL